MCQFDWPQGVWVKHYFFVCRGKFQMRLALELVDSVEKSTLPNVDGHHADPQGLNKAKGRQRRSSLLISCLCWAGTSPLIFSCPRTGIYVIGSPDSQVFRSLTFLGLQFADDRLRILSLHKHVSQFLKLGIILYDIGPISRENPG